MTKLTAMLAFLLAAIRLHAGPPAADYKLVWNDEFDGTTLASLPTA